MAKSIQRSKPVQITGLYIRESPSGKAFLLLIEDPMSHKEMGRFWIPKSLAKTLDGYVVEDFEYREKVTFTLPIWYLEKNGLDKIVTEEITEKDQKILDEYDDFFGYEEQELDFNEH